MTRSSGEDRAGVQTDAHRPTGVDRMAWLRWTALVLIVVALIIVPWLLWGQYIERGVMVFLSGSDTPHGFGYLLVGLLALDIFLPVPSSFVAVAAGVFLGTWQGTLAVSFGLSLGCVLGYFVGAKAGGPGARRLVGETEWARVERFAKTYGHAVVIGMRPVPVLAEASVLFAGATRMPFSRFMWSCVVANSALGLVYAAAGAFSAATGELEVAVMVGGLLPMLAFFAARWVSQRGS